MSVLQRLTTGNQLLDVCVTSLVVFLVQQLCTHFHDWLRKCIQLFTNFQWKSSASIDLTATFNDGRRFMPRLMCAMLHFTYDHLKDRKNVHFLDLYFDTQFECRRNEAVLFPISNKFLHLNKNISVYCSIVETQSEKDANKKSKEYKMTFRSRTLTLEQLYKRMTRIEQSLTNEDKALKRVYYIDFLNRDFEKQENRYTINEFRSKRRMSHIFLEDKDKIMKVIHDFANNKRWYDEIGLSRHLGILLHGQPGCGKTSFIKALANEFNYSILNVNMSRLQTIAELKDIFFNSEVNNRVVRVNKRMIVMEDIDCMGSLVQNRKTVDKEGDHKDHNRQPTLDSQVAHLLLQKSKKKNKDCTNWKNLLKMEPDVTLADLLNILDGILECPGRIVIMTTNHPERLDPALIRPGRIDLTVELKPASPTVLQDMFTWFYHQPIPDSRLSHYTHYLTPAEVVCTFKQFRTEPDLALKHLIPDNIS